MPLQKISPPAGKSYFSPRIGIGFMGKYDAGKDDVLVTVIMVEGADPDWVPQN